MTAVYLPRIKNRGRIFQLPKSECHRGYLYCCCSVTKSYLSLCNPMDCRTSGSPLLSLLRFMSIELVMLSNHLILILSLLLLPSIFPSIRVFSNESVLHIRQPKYWSFSISPSNEYSGMISFRIDWFDLLDHNLKTSFLQCSVFFMA